MQGLRFLLTTFLWILLLVSLLAAAPELGKPAPDFSSVDSNGTRHTLSAYKGKTVVLEWTNHECPFVGKHYNTGNMQTLQRYATAKEVVWLSVISSAAGEQGHVSGTQANALTRERYANPSAVLLDADGKVGRLYDARTTPHMYIINPEGTLVYMGGIDDKPSTQNDDVKTATNYVRLALEELFKGQAVSQAVTKPYGCSVKYR